MKKIIAVLTCIAICFCFICCDKIQNTSKTTYNISITLNEDMSANCSLDLNYVCEDNVDKLIFNLYPNAFSSATESPIYPEYFSEAYPNGIDYGEIDIKSVTVNDKSSNFTYLNDNKTHLNIPLNTTLKKGESVQVFISFNLIIPNVKHRYGYGDNTINLTGFYPVLCVQENGEYYLNNYYKSGDPFYSNIADYFVSLTLPSELIVASSMSPISVKYLGNFTRYNYQRFNVRDIAFIMSKKFNVMQKKVSDITVNYYYFKDKTPEKALNTAVENITWFSNNFYKYPYKEYVVCESDFIYGGMEYPCLSMIDCTLLGFDRDYCITHETAHQWWYGLVGNNECEESYIDEGLTEYSTLMFFDSHKEYGYSKNELLERVKNSYITIRTALAKKGITTPNMKRNLGEFTSDLEYVSIAYYRSQIAFDNLYNFMGEKRFYKFLKEVIKEYKYKKINTQNLLSIAEKIKKGSKNLLENYINGVAVVK